MTIQDAPTMHQQPPGTHRFVTVAEAVRMLGLSATTIRRKIEAGELEAERVQRPQGTAFLVKVPADEPPRADDAPETPQEPPDTHQDAPAGAAGIAAIVVPLVAQIDALRQTVERQAEQLISQAGTIGKLTAENEALRTAQTQQDANPGPEAPAPTTDAPVSAPSRWRVLASWVPLLVMLALAVVTLLLTLAVLALTP